MPDPEPTGDRIDQLRRRWQEDRGSRVFVQLAEEYRRRGEHASALEVLEEGLEAHPNYLSAQVAMGRVQLELGQVDAAREVFERVVAQDPTHLVALKLLTESLLRAGNRAGALEVLERFRLLGASREELEEMERSLGMGGREPAAATEAGGWGPVAAEPPEPYEEIGLEPEREWRPQADAASEPPETGSSGPGADGDGDREREIFRLEPVTPPPLRLTRGGRPASRQLLARAEAPFEPLPPPEPLRLVQEEVFPLWAHAGADATESRGETSAPERDDGFEPEAATVTLGEIYLRQGHLEEAEKIFLRVLAQDPGSEGARAGLAAVAGRREAPLTAESLLGSDGGQVRGITGRKILVLQRYLERIRAWAGRES